MRRIPAVIAADGTATLPMSGRIAIVKSGGPDTGYVRFECSCGVVGVLYSRRTIEGASLAKRDGGRHATAMHWTA